MAIEYWERGGRPKDYNPLPSAWTEKITLDPGDYRVTFKAMSPTSAQLGVKLDTTNVYPFNQALTTELKEYELNFTNPIQQPLYFKGTATPDNIVVKDIKVVEKPTGKTTINGVDGFGTVKAGFNGKLSAKGDFTGKVIGDISNNPHVAWRTGTNPPVTSLLTPNSPKLTGGGWYNEFVQDKLDGSYAVSSSNVNGGISQHMFTFDVIALIEKELTIKAIPYADKIQWLKDNVNKISVDWYGVGSGPAGNKANLKLWFYGTDAWGATTASHTSGSVTALNRTISTDVGNTFGPGGFVHAIAYTDASNGSIVSSISTDYISITVEMKQDAIVDSKWKFPPTVKVIDNNTIEQTALSTGIDERPYITVNVEPNTQYTLSHEEPNDAVYASYIKEGAGAGGASLAWMATDAKALTFTTTSNPVITITKVLGGAAVGVKKTFSKPMLNMGPNVLPYEPKRGERMVMPVVAGKNLVVENNVTIVAPTTTNVIHDEKVPTEVGKVYTLSVIIPVGVHVQARIGSTASIYNSITLIGDGTKKTMTFTATDPILTLRKYSNGVSGTFEVKVIQLEESGVFTSYNPFRVQRARKANLIPGKNLFSVSHLAVQFWTQGNQNALYKEYVLKPNTTYTLSSNVPVTATANLYFNGANTANNGVFVGVSKSVTTGSDGKLYVAVPNNPYREHTAKLLDGTYYIQLEEAAAATPFEPYKLQARRAVKERIIGKNLFPGFVPGYITVGVLNENPTSPDVGQVTSKWMPCEPNTPYTVSGGDRNTWHFKNAAGVINVSSSIPNPTTPSDAAFMRVYYSTNGSHKNIQVEKGLSATAYEPPKFTGRPARRGLEFNGATERIQANFPTGVLDALGANKDFTIESTFTLYGPNTANTPQQTIFSCGDIRFGMSNHTVNSMGFYTPASGWVDASPGAIYGRRITLKAVVKPTKIEIYFDGKFIEDFAYSGSIATVQTAAHIAALAGSSYFVNGSIESFKIVDRGTTILDFNFAKPANNLGTTFKAVTGPSGAITGNPIQLNRQARR